MGDIQNALNRKEIARRDCLTCRGKGWTGSMADQQLCETCGGTGFEEKEMDYDFARTRPRTPQELAHEAFGEPLPERGSIGKNDIDE